MVRYHHRVYVWYHEHTDRQRRGAAFMSQMPELEVALQSVEEEVRDEPSSRHSPSKKRRRKMHHHH